MQRRPSHSSLRRRPRRAPSARRGAAEGAALARGARPPAALAALAPLAALAAGCAGSRPGPEPAASGAPQTFDLLEVAISPGETRARIAVEDATAWSEPLVLRVESRPRSVRVDGGGAVVVEARGDLVRVTPEAAIPGDRHALVVEFAAGLHRVGVADPADRAAVTVTDAAGRVLADSPRVDPLRAPLRSSDTTPAEEVEAFARFCERTLLARWPADAAARPRVVARHWFGVLVPPADGLEGAAIAALPAVLAQLHAEASGRDGVLDALTSEGAHAEDLDAAWAVSRHADLAAEVGADVYREALRRLVLDRSGAGAPATWRDLGSAFEAVGSPAGAAYVRAWLTGPARPRVEARWRWDGERGRVLVRVDQVHAIEDGAPAAYPFTLPVRIVSSSGAIVDGEVEVTERRSLLPLECDEEPVALTFDPDGALAGRVDLRSVE